MRKFILGTIFGIIISVGVVYAASYYAKDVLYQPNDASWEVSNVNDAINSLYDNVTELKSLGDATASDILEGKTALVQGQLVTGTKLDSKKVHCGSYSANGSFDITTYGLSNVDVSKFIFVPSANSFSSNNAWKKDDNAYYRIINYYYPGTFSISNNTLTFTLPYINSRLFSSTNGTTDNRSVSSYTYTIPVDIYYIG